MAEFTPDKQFAVLMSAETFYRFQETNRELCEQSERINLGSYAQESSVELERMVSAMTDEEIMQYLPLADIEFRTAAAIIEDAVRIEQDNTKRLKAATDKLNTKTEQIESAADRLKKVLAKPISPL